ncbi:hypothetical protein PPERSA_10543 [Pseudocohnilembus persalinus]|uniref:Protein-tyrosine phosphatase-like protein n=1 Tax=Pseudocohnilembus persalinus TaxID=266149 RepID=A0A0V0QLQ6_PSEPJ|nr:hypothetical protein PPERSA_10543 [Pseudocohnilembus persalinus]|eukprot:KRX03170.1 hypothetical protein PPERSA_10543 [Pseudocohnilembus persalinus]
MQGNIYCDVFPYKHSKIAQNFHLNANYINSIFNEKLFVAAQAPTENSLQNFVLSLFFEPVSVVIMLCDYYHTEQYFTYKKGNLKINSELSVECLNIENKTGITKRILQINYQGVNKIITHYNFLSWPDNSVPQPENYPQIEELIEIIQTVNEKNNLENQQQQDKNLIFVHCMAGIGRTGTLITLANIFLLLNFYKENHKEDWESQIISIFSIIRREREQRQWIVQTEEQYEFVHKFTLRMFQKLFE